MLGARPSSSSDSQYPGSRASAVPKPAGLMSLGSAEDLAAKAAAIKEARKAKATKQKGQEQAKNKLKVVGEKLEEIDAIKESLQTVPESIM